MSYVKARRFLHWPVDQPPQKSLASWLFVRLFEKEGVLKDRVQTGYKTTSTKTHQTGIAKNRDITQTVKSP